jgi:hypothetical protein
MKKEVFCRLALALILQIAPMPGAFCQCDSLARINFIIVIDDKIVTNEFIWAKLVTFADGQPNPSVIELEYFPGYFCFNAGDTVGLNGDSLVLEFSRYMEQEINDLRTYQFRFYKSWFKLPFFILKVYNLDNRKYRREFPREKGKSYTYETVSPNGYMLRVRRR